MVTIPNYMKLLFCQNRSILVLVSLAIIYKKLSFLFENCFIFLKKNILLILNFNYFKLKKKRRLLKTNNLESVPFQIIHYKNRYRTKIKLKLIGVGFKFSVLSNLWGSFIQLKLGFSHIIFFKLPKTIKIKLLNTTKIIFVGDCFKTIKSTISRIKLLKLPEPYKGKGILYDNEEIRIKQSKRD